MVYLTCDMCKKVIENPNSSRTYFTLKTMHLCRACKRKVDSESLDKIQPDEDGCRYDFYSARDKYEELWNAKCSK